MNTFNLFGSQNNRTKHSECQAIECFHENRGEQNDLTTLDGQAIHLACLSNHVITECSENRFAEMRSPIDMAQRITWHKLSACFNDKLSTIAPIILTSFYSQLEQLPVNEQAAAMRDLANTIHPEEGVEIQVECSDELEFITRNSLLSKAQELDAAANQQPFININHDMRIESNYSEVGETAVEQPNSIHNDQVLPARLAPRDVSQRTLRDMINFYRQEEYLAYDFFDFSSREGVNFTGFIRTISEYDYVDHEDLYAWGPRWALAALWTLFETQSDTVKLRLLQLMPEAVRTPIAQRLSYREITERIIMMPLGVVENYQGESSLRNYHPFPEYFANIDLHGCSTINDAGEQAVESEVVTEDSRIQASPVFLIDDDLISVSRTTLELRKSHREVELSDANSLKWFRAGWITILSSTPMDELCQTLRPFLNSRALEKLQVFSATFQAPELMLCVTPGRSDTEDLSLIVQRSNDDIYNPCRIRFPYEPVDAVNPKGERFLFDITCDLFRAQGYSEESLNSIFSLENVSEGDQIINLLELTKSLGIVLETSGYAIASTSLEVGAFQANNVRNNTNELIGKLQDIPVVKQSINNHELSLLIPRRT